VVADRVWLEAKCELAQHVPVPDVDRMEVGPRREVFQPARAQVVDDQNLVAPLEGCLGDVTPNEASTSGH
jgi:hypothetical protein